MNPSASFGCLAVLAVSLAVTSRAFATPRAPDCSQLAYDQRATGLEPGVIISEVAAITGFVFFAVDAKPNVLPAFLLLDVIAVGGLLSFTPGCIVTPESELSRSPRILPPFATREEARAYRATAIRVGASIMGLNAVASGVMLLLVHKPASRIALGISTGFPLVYSLVNFRNFSPERDIDNSLPSQAERPKARLEIFPEIDLAATGPAIGAGTRLRF
jgi:hypothetical protein